MSLYPVLLEVVPLGQKFMRLDMFVAARHEYSRSAIKNLCDESLILINGESARASQKIKAGDRIDILRKYSSIADKHKAANLALDIIFEDESLIVINKAAGMAVHTGLGDHGNTLMDALIHHWKNQYMPFLVHRLDKYTTGLIVVAKAGKGAEKLSEEFAQRRAGRIYQTLVWGHFTEPHGKIESYIGRHPSRPESIEVSADASFGKHAITHYSTLEKIGPASLLSVKLDTGRTHQIRVHMHAHGHAILGDRRYPSIDADYCRIESRINSIIQGQALHASELKFKHPLTAISLHFSVPNPEVFTNIGKMLNISN